MICGIYDHVMCENLWKIYIWEYHLNRGYSITIRKNFAKVYGHMMCGNL